MTHTTPHPSRRGSAWLPSHAKPTLLTLALSLGSLIACGDGSATPNINEWELQVQVIRVGGASGSVQVTAADLETTCSDRCEYLRPLNDVVTLTPVTQDSEFRGWSEACAGNGAVTATGSQPFQMKLCVATFGPVGPAVCTPTANPPAAPTISFVNPYGGGCAGQLLFIGGTNFGATGTCVVSDGVAYETDAGSGTDVIRVLLPEDFAPGVATFDVSTLAGDVSVDVRVANSGAAVPTPVSGDTVAAGSSLVITGTNMGDVTEVRLSGAPQPNTCTITARTPTSVTCVVPNNVGSHSLYVANGCGGDAAGTLTITAP